MNTNILSSITQFKNHVELKDYRPATKQAYVRCLWRLAEHFEADPAKLTEEQLRQYFLFLREEQQSSPSNLKMAKWALRCYYHECVKVTGWQVFAEVRIAEPKTLPVVLTRQQVQQVLGVVREPRFALCLRLMYYCGLRVSEAVSLQVRDILGRQNPPCLHIRNGKGGKDRFVPLPPPLLGELRRWWRTHRNPKLVFPAPSDARQRLVVSAPLSQTATPMSIASVQGVFRLARLASGIQADATTHTLRHSYATHLLEEGVSLRQISSYLGHESLDTTAIYTHLTAVSEARTQAALQALYQAPPA
jgi:site-specific recombinase XerD